MKRRKRFLLTAAGVIAILVCTAGDTVLASNMDEQITVSTVPTGQPSTELRTLNSGYGMIGYFNYYGCIYKIATDGASICVYDKADLTAEPIGTVYNPLYSSINTDVYGVNNMPNMSGTSAPQSIALKFETYYERADYFTNGVVTYNEQAYQIVPIIVGVYLYGEDFPYDVDMKIGVTSNGYDVYSYKNPPYPGALAIDMPGMVCDLGYSSLLFPMAIPTTTITVSASDKPSDWAVYQVNFAIEEGLVPQNLQTNYTQAITRSEFCDLAVTVYENLKGEITDTASFSDTNDLNVEKLASIGVVSGVGENRFNPDGSITREQAAVILARLSDVIGQPFRSYTPVFSDNGNIASWAMESVGRVQAAGIMSGTGSNTFSPKEPYTMEQSIVTISRTYALLWRGWTVEPIPMKAIQTPPENTPTLDVSLISNNTPAQSIQADKLTGSWVTLGENGIQKAVMSDACHALQIGDYGKITLDINDLGSEIELKFSDDNYSPQFIRVQCWDAKNAGMYAEDILNNGEPVEVNQNRISVRNDGHGYIYEVFAIWPVGSSYYAFRTNSL